MPRRPLITRRATRRHLRTHWRVICLVWVLLLGRSFEAATAASDDPLSTPKEPPEAAVNKEAFLKAAWGLGASPESDLQLLATMTGAKLEPQLVKEVGRPPERVVWYRAYAQFFSRDRLVWDVSYNYWWNPDGALVMHTSMLVTSSFLCILPDDVQQILGPAEEMRPPPRRKHGVPVGRGLRYRTPHGAMEIGIYPECVGHISVGALKGKDE